MYERKGKFFSSPSTGGLAPILPREDESPSSQYRIGDNAYSEQDEEAAYQATEASWESQNFFSELTASDLEPSVSHVEDDAKECSGNLVQVVNQDHLQFQNFGCNNIARLCFIGTEISNINYMVRQRSQHPRDDTIHHLPSRQLARKCTAHNPDRIPPEAFALPEKALVDELIHAYFSHVNCGWPIVDEEDFMTKYNARDSRNPPALTLLHAILLVGAHVLSRQRNDVAELKATFFSRAKTLLDARFEQDRTMHLQVALLMTWHSDGAEDILANSWQWVGHAARIALGLGMHRDSASSNLLPVYKRAWVRLWWVLVQFDVLVSVAYGRPQALNIDDSDVPTLTDAHFEGIPHAQRDFVIQHVRLCIILSKAMKQRGSLRSSPHANIQAIKQVDEALADFAMRLPEHMRLSLSNVDVWQSTLHLTYNNFLILLHRAPQNEIRDPPTSESLSDLEICRDSAMTVTLILEGLRTNGTLSGLWLSGINSLFTAILQVSTELDSNNPVVASKSLRRFDSLLLCLRELSRDWLYAMSVLRLFEDRASKDRQRQH
ncbi:hypothetical protein QQX98_008594 [Neonectria punicea]|uniref:Xylanolytic transcriptional activator regulatory domain-containing protein n=1 Tax=Neonectria punicea TaxID=979145 RepID=A0ABR1GUK8_9HYPO